MHIYDYLFAAVIIVALLLGSTVMVSTFSSPASDAADKDLLKITAEKIMTHLLLDSGYPDNWGSANTNPQDLQVFGLAKCGATSRQAYELDPDKVQRLNSALDGAMNIFVSPDIAAHLLNLDNIYGALDYGFTLEFNETINVDVSFLDNDAFSVSVFSDYGLPIMGATVSATLYYVDTWTISSVGPVYANTTFDGSCTLNLYDASAVGSPSKVLAVCVYYFGSQAPKLFNVANAVPASLFASYALPYPNSSFSIGAGYDCHEIVIVKNSSGVETRDFQISSYGNPQCLTFDVIPESTAIGVLAVAQDEQLIFAQREFSDVSYRTIPAVQSTTFAYSLERTVLIGGVTFTATLYFWRMSS